MALQQLSALLSYSCKVRACANISLTNSNRESVGRFLCATCCYPKRDSCATKLSSYVNYLDAEFTDLSAVTVDVSLRKITTMFLLKKLALLKNCKVSRDLTIALLRFAGHGEAQDKARA